MLRPLLSLLGQEVSGQNCLDHVQTITRYHRIQASPGYRAAAEECRRILESGGVDAVITSYPATGRHRQWTNLTPQEWECKEAELWLLDEKGNRVERLAWYQEMNIAIIQRSCSTPGGGVTADLIVIDQAEAADSWADKEVAGKIALVGNGDIHRMLHHAQEAGALGLITARMSYNPPSRPIGDLADAIQYTSFWWSEDEPKGWGFVLPTRQGERLKQMAARGKVKLWANVVAEFSDGAIENVEAVIPAASDDPSDQEVLVVAHLCHPRPSANDNASGPATVMESARALAALIGQGRLPAPRRAIRFLLVPEMTGTYAHLANRTPAERERIVAAINDDMVGQKQAVTGSTLLCEYPPLACPSFAGDLAALLLERVARDAPTLSGLGPRYASIRHAAVPFSGGSDHYILSDPSVGIPCPMLIQWPDRFYHTSADTLEKSDPAMMRRVGILTAAYAYFLANAGPAEVAWLASEMVARFPAQLHEAVQESEEPRAVAAFRTERKLTDLQSLRRLASEAEWAGLSDRIALCEEQLRAIGEMERRRLPAAPAGSPSPGAPALANSTVVEGWSGSADLTRLHPRRVHPGPVSLRNDLDRLPEADSWRDFSAGHPGAARLGDYLCFWADGQRSLAEICRLVELETGFRSDSWALGYFQLLSRLKFVTGV